VATLSALASRLRAELGDTGRSIYETFTGDGINTRFKLSEAPVDGATLVIKVNGSDVSTDVTVEEATGLLILDTAPANNSVITVTGTAFRYFTTSEICYYVSTAFTEHARTTVDSNGTHATLRTLPAVDEYPLVILASSLALYTLATDASFDIDIISPDGVSIPRSERFRQVMEIVQTRKDQYKELCSMLGVGLYRIEMGTLRRISRLTNRYIPVYLNQEIDDSSKPERVYLGSEIMGHSPMETTAQIYDILLYQGDSWSAEFDFPFDVTGLEFKAQIRTYPNAPATWATFTITTISTSETLSKIEVSLPRLATDHLPPRAFWDLQATSLSDPTYEVTYIRGKVITTQEVTV